MIRETFNSISQSYQPDKWRASDRNYVERSSINGLIKKSSEREFHRDPKPIIAGVELEKPGLEILACWMPATRRRYSSLFKSKNKGTLLPNKVLELKEFSRIWEKEAEAGSGKDK